jgi:hypothetical protein
MDLITPYKANDKYRAILRSTWIASPADTTLSVNAIPTNVPTIIVAGWGTDYETVFSVTATSGTSSADYALTGVARIKGANANIPENTAVNCLNNEEFFNQYGTSINDVIGVTNDAVDAVEAMQAIVDIITIGVEIFDSSTSTATGDGKAFFRVPPKLNGMDLIGIAATVYTAGITGNLDIQIRNKTDSVDMLSTVMRIESTETDTSTSAQPGTIDTTHDDVATGDVIAIDIDAIQSGTVAKGLYVELRFQLPA